MSKKTFHMTVSTTIKVVVDGESITKAVTELTEHVQSDAFKNAPMNKLKAMAGMVYEASLKSEEHAAAEIIRFNLREGLNEAIRNDVCGGKSDGSVRITAAPVRVRFEDLADE